MKMRFWTFMSLTLLLYAAGASAVRSSSRVVLENHGYEGVLIALEERLPAALCEEVVRGLEEILREASRTVFVATRGLAQFRNVKVLVPTTWDASSCQALGDLGGALRETYENADFRITQGAHPTLGAKPWTLHSRGCGETGDYISMGYEFLMNNLTFATGSRLLAHEWLKYRYGVFDETGRLDDPLMPTYFRASDGEWKPTTCANVPLELDHSCGIRDPSCPKEFHPQEEEGLTKSFMAAPELPSVSELCDEGSHVRDAPTLHNLLCDGKSVWEVIRASPDFQGSRNDDMEAEEQEVSFQYIQPTKPRIILLIEDTNVMNVQKRWDFMRKALKKFVTYDVPDGHSIGLVVFDSIAASKYPLTVLSDAAVREKIGSSLPRKPSREGQHKRCIICGLRESLRLLHQDSLGGHIVLVTAGNGIVNEMEYAEAVEILDRSQVTLHSIIYPLTERYPKPAEGLERLAAHTGGDTFIVPDEGIGADSKLSMYYNLLDAFYHTLSIALGHSTLPIKVHSAEHPGGRVPVSEGSFLMDPSLGSDTVFAIFYYDMTHVGNLVHLVSPHGQVIDTANMQKEDANINMITIRLMEAQVTSGLWKYKVENHADSHQALYVQVTSRPRSQTPTPSIDLRAWTNHPSGVVNVSDATQPFALYTELMAGSRSIEKAQVTAILSRLGHFNGSQYPPVEIELLDNGYLGPDVMKGDGVYSRYVPSLTSAKYSVTVKVEGTLDGFTFSRHARIGTISITGTPPLEDIVSPSRVMDFNSVLSPDTPLKIRFTWTSPGGDHDFGFADRYVVMKSLNRQDLLVGHGTILENWPQPLQPLTPQEHIIDWNEYDTVSYLALYAVDAVGNEAPLSNIITVYVPSPPTTTSYPSSSAVPFPPPNNSASREDTAAPVLAALDTRQLAVLLGCLGGIIVVICLILCYCKAIHHRHRKATAAKKSGEPQDSYSVTVTISPKGSDFSENKDSQQGLKKDYISPVESWSASQLLSNHSENKRSSVSSNSDNSNQSVTTKKMYGDYSAGNECTDVNPYQYQYVTYPDHYQTSSEGFPTPTEDYPTPTDEYPPPPEDFPSDNYPPPSEVHSYISSQPSDSFLSVSCDILPSTHGPPAYAPYPSYDASLRSAKIPPPIPPKPKVLYTPEPYMYDTHSLDPHSSNLSVASDKRVRNVTMV